MHALDAIDRKILSLLQSDSRMTMQELADKVGLSVSPCHRRVKLLEQRGVITRYIATVDQKSLGLACQRLHLDQTGAAEGRGSQSLCESDLEMGRGAGVLLDDRQPRLSLARRRRGPVVLRGVPEEQTDASRRHRLDRVELCAEPGKVLDRAAGVALLNP